MKTSKNKFGIILFLLFFSIMNINAQSLLSQLNRGQRIDKLIKISNSILETGDNALMKDQLKKPEVIQYSGFEVTSKMVEVVTPGDAFYKAKIGSIYYIVSYPVMDSYRYLYEEDFGIRVYIWDDGTPFQIWYGGSGIKASY